MFHNLSGYDAHMFIRELAKYSTNDMNVITKSKENYISFSAHVPLLEYDDGRIKTIELRFIDSYKFMASSLDSLTTDLVKGGKRLFDLDDNLAKYRLLTRKGVYPYEYMDSWDRFNETRFPSMDKFYSKLNGVGISEDDYKHATNIWNEIDINNLGEYLRTDVVLLANGFEEFRNGCMKRYGLDPADFYTSPGLAWQACLKKTEIKWELLTDPDMLLMFEAGIRGGITQAVHRYAAANNKYIDNYNPNTTSSYIQYLDANSLYAGQCLNPYQLEDSNG